MKPNINHEKKLTQIDIFEKTKKEEFTWKDIKHLELDDDCIIDIQITNLGTEDIPKLQYDIHIYKMIEESDEAFQTRIQKEIEIQERRTEQLQLERKEHRRKEYLKLKEEFEPEHTVNVITGYIENDATRSRSIETTSPLLAEAIKLTEKGYGSVFHRPSKTRKAI